MLVVYEAAMAHFGHGMRPFTYF